jgi:hypothetical protein
MASTLAYGLNYVANQQLKKFINDLKNDDHDNLNYTSATIPIIYTRDDLRKTSPFVSVTPIGTSSLQYTYGRFDDLNKDKAIQKKITKYFLYKILDKWMYNDFRHILAYVKISDGKPSLIRSMSDYKQETISSDSVENIEKRIEYLEKILINKKLVKHVLKKVISENNIQWVQLNKHKSLIKKILKKYINSKLEDAIKSASKFNE